MSIREFLQKNPIVGIGIALLVAIAGVVLVVSNLRPRTHSAFVSQGYFTSDDGKHWFADSIKHVPPYSHEGAEAVRCYVYDAGNGPFVGFLKKYTPEARARLEAVLNSPNPALTFSADDGALVKRPGNADWIPVTDPKAAAVYSVHSPNDKTITLDPIDP